MRCCRSLLDLGESVAKPELLILACLLKRFTFRLPEGAKYDVCYDVMLCTYVL